MPSQINDLPHKISPSHIECFLISYCPKITLKMEGGMVIY